MSSLRDYEIAGDSANYNHYTPKGVKKIFVPNVITIITNPFPVLACPD